MANLLKESWMLLATSGRGRGSSIVNTILVLHKNCYFLFSLSRTYIVSSKRRPSFQSRLIKETLWQQEVERNKSRKLRTKAKKPKVVVVVVEEKPFSRRDWCWVFCFSLTVRLGCNIIDKVEQKIIRFLLFAEGGLVFSEIEHL